MGVQSPSTLATETTGIPREGVDRQVKADIL
jgi:hypothetical protein